MRPNRIVKKMVLDRRDPSNLKPQKVLNETVVNLRRKFYFLVDILGNFTLMKKEGC